MLGTGRSHMEYACNNHGRVARQGPSQRGQNESTPEQDASLDDNDDNGDDDNDDGDDNDDPIRTSSD